MTEPAGRLKPAGDLEDEVLRNLDALHAAALALTGSSELAEDLVSDAIRHAAGRWELHRLGANVRVWLMEVLHLLFISRSQRSGTSAGRGPDQPGTDTTAARYDSLTGDEIRRTIAALPSDYRAAVVFGDLRDLSYAELARVLGVPERTAMSRLHEGRRMLQAGLDAGLPRKPGRAVS